VTTIGCGSLWGLGAGCALIARGACRSAGTKDDGASDAAAGGADAGEPSPIAGNVGGEAHPAIGMSIQTAIRLIACFTVQGPLRTTK
jgi:hypothetical protein